MDIEGYGHTIMVSAKILSRYQGPPPPPVDESGERCLGVSAPLYAVEDVAAAMRSPLSLQFGSRLCHREWQELMDTLEAQEEPVSFTQFLMDAMRLGRWREAVWCRNDKECWFAADAWEYEFGFGRNVGRQWVEYKITYYLKFSITKNGLSMYMLSCHPSR